MRYPRSDKQSGDKSSKLAQSYIDQVVLMSFSVLRNK